MKNFLLKSVTGLMLFSLIACGPGERRKAEEINTTLFPSEWKSDKEAIEGGTLKIAVVSDNPFKGIFSPVLYQDSTDSTLFITKISPEIFWNNADFNLIDGGMANVKLDVDNKVITVKIREGLKWEDGNPITVDDYIFGAEIIGHKDYTGVRYSDGIRNIVGMEEYHKGMAKTIKGFEKISDTELKIHVKVAKPEILTGGGGLTGYFVPKHYLKDIAIKDLEQSDRVRLKPLSYGPYKVSQIIPGESIEYVVNENYYDKEHMPKVDKLIMKILPSSSVIKSMEIGEYDFYYYVASASYKLYKDFDNLKVVGTPSASYVYVGFNLGYWDEKKKENVVDPNKKMADIRLRKAMGYALDMNKILTQFFEGLKQKANSPIPPIFSQYYNPKPRYDYDLEKANALLDEAGYKDIDGDGIREGKDGKPFVIEMAFGDSEIAEELSTQFIQDWAKVGLKVELATGRLMGNNFFPTVESNKGYDIWLASWGVGTALDFSSVYGKTAKFNFARITDEKNEELIRKTSSLEAVKDLEYRKKAILEWEDNYMENVLGFLPIWYSYTLYPVNKRYKEFTTTNDNREEVKFVDALTQKEPIAATVK
ncbi:ABC transporter substrate-binding protein [Oceanivirga salmonicida]|uniref:ABC transporter substrate-binding protein n=1 Tax=Oceanivirga salmonicida TaxID=1769291 RepID=UPI00082EE01F|nr:ABC transporter substrate-binding protein [Oceanivirga salmonicida]